MSARVCEIGEKIVWGRSRDHWSEQGQCDLAWRGQQTGIRRGGDQQQCACAGAQKNDEPGPADSADINVESGCWMLFGD